MNCGLPSRRYIVSTHPSLGAISSTLLSPFLKCIHFSSPNLSSSRAAADTTSIHPAADWVRGSTVSTNVSAYPWYVSMPYANPYL